MQGFCILLLEKHYMQPHPENPGSRTPMNRQPDSITIGRL
jgi:hypothetical protein